MKLLIVTVLFSVIFSSCKTTPRQVPDIVPVHQNFSITSKLLNEVRMINVFTPAGYSANKDSFPVLYMLDGGIKEDFPHIANTIDTLIKNKSIPPIILVGIENTERKRDLTGPTQVEDDKNVAPVVGESQQFRSFISKELFAEINKRYRTTAVKSIIGESLAGLFVIETFLTEPVMFDNYIAMDPSLWWNNAWLVNNVDARFTGFSGSSKKLWFAGSSAKDIFVHTEALDKILKSKNIINLQFFYSSEPKEEHGTIFKATKEKALRWTLAK